MPAKNSIVRTPCARWLGLGAAAVAGSVFAAEPHIGVDLIAPTILTLHFDTDPLRSYTVQFRQQQANGSYSTNWTNFYFVAAQPFSNHYVIVDYPTNRSRLYRLLVTP